MNEKSKSTWSVIVKIIIAVVSALAGALGVNACIV